jgi:hypothetical protein
MNTIESALKRADPFRTGPLGGGGLLERLYFYRRLNRIFVAEFGKKSKKIVKNSLKSNKTNKKNGSKQLK